MSATAMPDAVDPIDRTRGRVPRRTRRGRPVDPFPLWLAVLVSVIALYLVLPTLIVIPMSFSPGLSFRFPPTTFSWDLYRNFFTDPQWIGSLGNSVLVAVLASLLATVAGTAAAIGLHSMRGRLAGMIRTLLMFPLVAPGIVVAVAVYSAFLRWHLVGSLPGYVLAHAAIGLPFVLVAVTASLGGLDPVFARAATVLGASRWRIFLTVTLPLISRGILSGAVFALVTSFDEVVIALFIRSPKFQTLPVQMYNSVRTEIDPTVAAAASLIVVTVTVLFLMPQLFALRRRR